MEWNGMEKLGGWLEPQMWTGTVVNLSASGSKLKSSGKKQCSWKKGLCFIVFGKVFLET